MVDGGDNQELDLIKAAVGGDSSAFGVLYDRYQAMIYRFVMIKVGRREEAEDITHQVFLSAWQSVRTYRHKGFPFSSWLYRIARNQIIDHYRAGANRKGEVSIEKADPESFAVAVDHAGNIEAKIELETVRAAVARLRPDYQDVIILRFVEDMSLKESAAALGKSEGAVKLLQHRAIRELKKSLAGDPSIAFDIQ